MVPCLGRRIVRESLLALGYWFSDDRDDAETEWECVSPGEPCRFGFEHVV